VTWIPSEAGARMQSGASEAMVCAAVAIVVT